MQRRDTVDRMPAPLARDLQSGPSLWFLAPFERVPLPAWAIGLLISFAIMALYVAIEFVYQAAGATARPLWTAERWVLPGALLVGYIPTFVCYAGLASERTWRELRPLVRNSDAELDAIMAERPSPTTRALWLAGLAGALAISLRLYYEAGVPLSSFLLGGWDHYRVFGYGLNLALFTMLGQLVYLWFGPMRGRSVDRRSWNLDLLDLRPLTTPFVREGTTLALLWVVNISIISLIFLAEGDRSPVFFVGMLLFCLAWMAATLILPMRRVHRLISRHKQEELERVGAAIRGDRSALADSGIATQAETLSLADLVAYRDLIASVREWPVQPATFLRLFALLVIPVGSWVGGALVERMLGSVLD